MLKELFGIRVALVLVQFVYSVTPIQIQDGVVKGFIENVNRTDVHTFLGIPFAKPPVGGRRFRRPEPVEPWDGVLNATAQPPSCTQHNMPYFSAPEPQSEDCLYLNVWTPSMEEDSTGLKTVMVWIYGGGLMVGSIVLDVYNGKRLAASEDVVVVSMNYRLGPAGFLYLGTEEAPGNMGLMDQQLALEWVQKNIRHFGGDPERVTIFGESAGSFSVGYHLLSAGSQPLFKHAIMQSGAPIMFREPGPAKELNMALIKEMGCHQNNIQNTIQCQEKYDVNELTYTLFKMNNGTAALPITADGVFLEDSPERLYEAGKHKSTNLMIGTTEDEGSLLLFLAMPQLFNLSSPPSLTRQQFLDITGTSNDPITSMAVEFEYTVKNGHPGRSYARQAADALGDPMLVCPSVKFAEYYAAKGEKVFMYQLAHKTKNWWVPIPDWFGAAHGMDIDYVFGNPAIQSSPDELKLSKRVQKYWASFAKTGVPDGGEDKWPMYKGPAFPTNILDLEPAHVTNRLNHRRCRFWYEYLPSLKEEFEKAQSRNSGNKDHVTVVFILLGFVTFVLMM